MKHSIYNTLFVLWSILFFVGFLYAEEVLQAPDTQVNYSEQNAQPVDRSGTVDEGSANAKAISQTSDMQADSSEQIARRIIESDMPVFVYFWAVWCSPCKISGPIVEELKQEYKDRVLFAKVDVDRHKSISAYFNVQAIPSIFLVLNKNVLHSIPGVRSKEYYVEKLDQIIKKHQEREK